VSLMFFETSTCTSFAKSAVQAQFPSQPEAAASTGAGAGQEAEFQPDVADAELLGAPTDGISSLSKFEVRIETGAAQSLEGAPANAGSERPPAELQARDPQAKADSGAAIARASSSRAAASDPLQMAESDFSAALAPASPSQDAAPLQAAGPPRRGTRPDSSSSEEPALPGPARSSQFSPVKGKLSFCVFTNLDDADMSAIADEVCKSPWSFCVFPQVDKVFVRAFLRQLHPDDEQLLQYQTNKPETVLLVGPATKIFWFVELEDMLVQSACSRQIELGSLTTFNVQHRKPQFGAVAHALACLALKRRFAKEAEQAYPVAVHAIGMSCLKFGTRLLCGDFGGSGLELVELLRAAGFTANVAAWNSWAAVEGNKLHVDRGMVIVLGPVVSVWPLHIVSEPRLLDQLPAGYPNPVAVMDLRPHCESTVQQRDSLLAQRPKSKRLRQQAARPAQLPFVWGVPFFATTSTVPIASI